MPTRQRIRVQAAVANSGRAPEMQVEAPRSPSEPYQLGRPALVTASWRRLRMGVGRSSTTTAKSHAARRQSTVQPLQAGSRPVRQAEGQARERVFATPVPSTE